MKNYKPALRTARALMTKGLLGADLWGAFDEAHPGLHPKVKEKVAARVRKEVGILGHVAHDPNQFPNCRVAKREKQANPHPHRLLLTYRTPMCATCTCNRKGSCALMGGRLVGDATDVPEETVTKTAQVLVSDGALSKREASRVAGARLSASRRVASMNLLQSIEREDPVASTRATASSRMLGAMLDNSGQTVTVTPSSLKGPSRVVNADVQDGEVGVNPLPGDSATAKRARKIASMMEVSAMIVEVPDAPVAPRGDVQMKAASSFDIPPKFGEDRDRDIDEENARQAQSSLSKLIQGATKLWNHGRLTAALANQVYDRLDTLRQFGAIPNAREARIARQLGIMSGELEL